MSEDKKVRYLKIGRGRYYYQRRVPDRFQELLGISKWQFRCGDVGYAKAVQLVVNWAEEHDDLLAKLKTSEGYDAIEGEILRDEDAAIKGHIEESGGTPVLIHEDRLVPFDEHPKPWNIALEEVADLDAQLANTKAPEHEVMQLKAKIAHAKGNGTGIGKVLLAPYPEFL